MIMSYKKPNVTGPRVRMTTQTVMSKERLKQFNEKYPEHKGVTASEFSKLIKLYNKALCKEVVRNQNGINFPQKIGRVGIHSFPLRRGVAVDYGTSNKTGKLTYFANWGTDNKIAKIIFTCYTKTNSFKLGKFWNFFPTKSFKKEASEGFKENWERYLPFKLK
jgi:hypothetical protein